MTSKEIKMKHAELIDEYNELINKGCDDEGAFLKKSAEIKRVESDYAEARAKEVIEELAKAENPMKEAILLCEYSVLASKLVKEEGVPVGIEACTKMMPVSLLKLCIYAKLSKTWHYKMQALSRAITCQKAKGLGYNATQIEKIYETFSMKKPAEDIAVPSKNTVQNMLQQILDDCVYEEGVSTKTGKPTGKNTYKVLNCDVNYLLETTAKAGTGLKVIMASQKDYERRILKIMHRILVNESYEVVYKARKS